MGNNRGDVEADLAKDFLWTVFDGEFSAVSLAAIGLADAFVTGGEVSETIAEQQASKVGIDVATEIAHHGFNPSTDVLYSGIMTFQNWQDFPFGVQVPLPNKFVPYVAAKRKTASPSQPPVTQAATAYQIRSGWLTTGSDYLNVEHGLAATPILSGWVSAKWILDRVGTYDIFRLRNVWTNQFLHIQNGPLQCGPVLDGWQSAWWTVENVAGTKYFRIRNFWRKDQCINLQQQSLAVGPVLDGWVSAYWIFLPA